MPQLKVKYPHQKYVGIATRKSDGTLNHEQYTLVDVVPQKGQSLLGRNVVEVLTDEELLKERSRYAQDEISAVAVLGEKA